MRWLVLALGVLVLPVLAQEKKKAPAPKKAAAQKMPAGKAHSKPSPEQIRKFNEIEKKQGK